MAPWFSAACAVILAFIGPSTVPLLQAAMSEPLYLCLSMGALLALDSARAIKHALTESESVEAEPDVRVKFG